MGSPATKIEKESKKDELSSKFHHLGQGNRFVNAAGCFFCRNYETIKLMWKMVYSDQQIFCSILANEHNFCCRKLFSSFTRPVWWQVVLPLILQRTLLLVSTPWSVSSQVKAVNRLQLLMETAHVKSLSPRSWNRHPILGNNDNILKKNIISTCWLIRHILLVFKYVLSPSVSQLVYFIEHG